MNVRRIVIVGALLVALLVLATALWGSPDCGPAPDDKRALLATATNEAGEVVWCDWLVPR